MITSKLLAETVTWTIPLERVEATADEKFEFLVKQLGQVTLRLTHLEELLEVGKDVQRPVFAAINIANYTLSSDRRKVTKSGNDSSWQSFLSEQSFSAMGNKFKISLDVIYYSQSVAIGVAKKNIATNGGVHTKNGSWMVYLYLGKYYLIFNNGSNKHCGQTQFRTGSRLAVSLELITKQLSFELDGALVYSLALADTNDLFAAVDLSDKDTSLSFI